MKQHITMNQLEELLKIHPDLKQRHWDMTVGKIIEILKAEHEITINSEVPTSTVEIITIKEVYFGDNPKTKVFEEIELIDALFEALKYILNELGE